MKHFRLGLVGPIFLFTALVSSSTFAQTSTATIDLAQGFQSPPASAKPQTWFHAMSGNMSKVGVTKDLESLAEVGMGGVMLFNVTQGVPIGKIKFNSDEHLDIIQHMAKEAHRLDLKFTLHNCDGWSSSGGPWVTPEHSMKKVTWSETTVEGGKNIELQLPTPPRLLNYYQDIALIAFPSIPAEVESLTLKPVITSSDTQFNPALIQDNTWETTSTISFNDKQENWLQFSYEKPYRLGAITMLMREGRNTTLRLLTSNDGKDFTDHGVLALRRTGKSEWGYDSTFDGIHARYFKFVTDRTIAIKEMQLMSSARIDEIYNRSSIGKNTDILSNKIRPPAADMVIKKNKIINLSAAMDKNGLVKTQLPKGHWTLLRMGYTTTAAVNIPASKEGTGLEIDKFSRAAVDIHYEAYTGRVRDKIKNIAPKAFYGVEIDSYEVGGQNWTLNYEKLFKEKYGYDLISFLPVYTGRFVESSDASTAVLWDIRNFNNYLITENYYGHFADLAHRDGLTVYIEPYGNGPFNDLDAGAKADIPMGEFWLNRETDQVTGAISTGHIYNKNIIATESFTGHPEVNWKFHPALAKKDGDYHFAMGVNEFVFHRFAHQANTHVEPGMVMNRWGSHVDRTQTWWTGAGKAWFDYLTRSQFMLRQGIPVSDLLLFVGDDTPIGCPGKRKLSASLPENMNYDCINSDALINRLSVKTNTLKRNELVLPEGTAYKFLLLHNTDQITLKTLQKINELSAQGAIIVGHKPLSAPGYSHLTDKASKSQFEKLTQAIWSRKTTYTPSDSLANTWKKVVSDTQYVADMSISNAEKSIQYAHRKTSTEDIYFFSNPEAAAKVFDVHFRVAGKMPERWNPLTATREKFREFVTSTHGTQIPVKLHPNESVFVVFKEPVDPTSHVTYDEKKLQTVTDTTQALALDGPWKVTFNKKYGFGKTLTFKQLTDWSKDMREEIKYYSGTADYQRTFSLPEEHINAKHQIILDLGQVHEVATVTLNGKTFATSWIAPHRIDVTNALKKGKNTLSIEVANLWPNRLIGDERFPRTDSFTDAEWVPKTYMPEWYTNNQPAPKDKRITFTTAQFYKETDPLLPSGLLGPVSLQIVKHHTLEE